MAAEVSPYGVRPGLATGLGTIDNFGPSQQYMPGGAGTAEAKAGEEPARKAAIQAQIRDLERTLAALKAQL
jgi:hypothetical protein